MAGKKIKKDYFIHSFDTDYRLKMRPSRILCFFQDIAMWQSEDLGVGLKYLEEKNFAWVIVRYNIKIHKYPRYMDTVRIETYPDHNRKLYYFRKFIMYSEEGECLIEADSSWMLIDKKNETLRLMTEEMQKVYGYKDEEYEKIEFAGISKIKESDNERTFQVRYSEIDSNLHVNNTVYLSWAIETMLKEVVVNYEINNIEVQFKKEAKYGDEITVKTLIQEKIEDAIIAIHNICNQEGHVICLIRTKWRKILNPDYSR